MKTVRNREADTFRETEDVASSTECTGLIPALPLDNCEDQSLSALYGVRSAPGDGEKAKKRRR